MTLHNRLSLGPAFGLLALLFSSLAGAASPVVLAPFNTGSFYIGSPLIVGSNGNFYATAPSASCCGEILELTPAGSISVLATLSFADGNEPTSIIQGSDGNFYGTAIKGGSSSCTLWNQVADGGCGTVFKMTPSGTVSNLTSFTFTNGGEPGFFGGIEGLVQGPDGNFYGTTFEGGTTDTSGPCYAQGCGTVFKITPAGAVSTLLSFSGTNGANPTGALIVGSNGNFYGTTYTTVYELTLSGTLTALATLPGGQLNGVILGTDGNFYGTSSVGGGSVFQVTQAGAVTILNDFAISPVALPNAGSKPSAPLIQASDGNFYGTTNLGGYYGYGTVFKMTLAGELTTLFSFDNDTLGAEPTAPLTEGPDGNLYGTTPTTFFKVCMSCAAPPQGLAVTNIATDTVDLGWNAALGAETYNVYAGTTGGVVSATPLMTGVTGTSVAVTGLTNLTAYTFAVAALGGGGSSAYSNIVSATPLATVPTAPTLSVTVSNGLATLSWTTPTGPLGSQAAYSYNIYEGSVAGGEATTPAYANITATEITVAAPVAGAGTYYFEVTALNGNGESGPSNEVNASLATLAAPSTPVLNAATAGPGTVALSWAAVGTDTTYSIFEGTAAGGESSVPVQRGVTTPYVTVAGLTNGTRYYFTVVATNPAGTSAASSELSAVPTPTVVATSSSGSSSSSSTKATTTSASNSSGGGSLDSWTLAALAALYTTQRWLKRSGYSNDRGRHAHPGICSRSPLGKFL